MDDKLLDISNENKQNYPFRSKFLIKMFGHN